MITPGAPIVPPPGIGLIALHFTLPLQMELPLPAADV